MSAIRKLTDRYVASVIDDEVVLIDLDGGLIMAVRGSARAIWEAIDGERDADAIVRVVAGHFEGDVAAIERETRTFLADLAARRLVAW